MDHAAWTELRSHPLTRPRAPFRLSEAFLYRGPFVVARMIKFALTRFQREQHLSGVFLPLPRLGQNAIENLFHLVFRHGRNDII
jgi:hypothetical protein